jgi:hypothetical protein
MAMKPLPDPAALERVIGQPSRPRIAIPGAGDVEGAEVSAGLLAAKSGEAIRGIGAGLETDLEGELFKRDKIDTARAKASFLKSQNETVRKLLDNPKFEDHPDAYNKAMKSALTTASKLIRGAEARQFFDLWADTTRDTGMTKVMEQSHGLEIKAGRDEFDTDFPDIANLVISETDPVSALGGIEAMDEYIDAARANGYIKTDAEARALKAKFSATVAYGRIKLMPPGKALEVLKNKDEGFSAMLEPLVRDEMIDIFEKEDIDAQAQAGMEIIYDTKLTLPQMTKKARAGYSGQVETKLIGLLTARVKEDKDDRELAIEVKVEGSWVKLMKLAKGDPEKGVKPLTGSQLLAEIDRTNPPDVQAAQEDYAKNTQPVTLWKRYYEIQQMPDEKLLATDLYTKYRHLLADAQFTEMVNYQTRKRAEKPSPPPTGLMTRKEQIAETVRMMGYTGEEAGKFAYHVNVRMDEVRRMLFKSGEYRQLTHPERHKIISDVLVEGRVAVTMMKDPKRRLFQVLGTDKAARFYLEDITIIPLAERENIMGALTAAGMPTEPKDVLDLYLKNLLDIFDPDRFR